MTREEAAWLAGLLEGEGSFRVTNLDRPNTCRPCLQIELAMSDKDVVKSAAALMGSRSVRAHSSSARKPGWSTMWRCTANGSKAEYVLRVIRPYMHSRRGAKIDELLALPLSHRLKESV